MNALLEAYFFYDIKRFDIKGKEFLRTLGKYYIVDIGLRNYLLGFRDRDSGHAIENMIKDDPAVSTHKITLQVEGETNQQEFVVPDGFKLGNR